MARIRRWLHTDEYTDAEVSLKKCAELSVRVGADISEWKWLLIAVHSAVQGIFVLALSRGNGLLTLKSSHAAAWLKSYQRGLPWPDRLDLDYFLELHAKAKRHILCPPGAFITTAAHDEAMRKLNDLRNGFIHFGAQRWSIELAGLPTISLQCLAVAEHLGWVAGCITWHSISQATRTRRALRIAIKHLRQLETEYQR